MFCVTGGSSLTRAHFRGKLRLHEEDDGPHSHRRNFCFAFFALSVRKAGAFKCSYATADDYSPYTPEKPLRDTRGSLLLKELFDKHHNSPVLLLLVVLLRISMVIGDGIIRALSPYYVYFFLKKAGKDGRSSLGRVVLCITGAEATFADLGHFSQLSIRIAFTTVVYPSLIVAYMGGAAYYSEHARDLERSFFKVIPAAVFWQILVIATIATAVASRAIISATFSITSQFRALRCFPCVKEIHTSSQIHGEIYMSEVNWILMVLCIAVVVGFRDTDMIGNTYGLAVIAAMFVATCLMFLEIVTVWKGSFLAALAFCIRHYGTIKKHSFEQHNKVPVDMILTLVPHCGITRVPGICLIYSNVVSGVPPMFAHFVTNFPACHRILVFVTIQSFTVPKVPVSEQFLVTRIGLPKFCFCQCIVWYGYKDARKDAHAFENQLLETIAEFLHKWDDDCNAETSRLMTMIDSSPKVDAGGVRQEIGAVAGSNQKRVRARDIACSKGLQELEDARESGLAYMMGNTCVLTTDASSYMKKFVINILYGLLRRNCRRPATALGVPYTSLIELGMTYQV
ncbi:probable potassium transporter 13 [Mangifera indica]|uniref:probable potassium transporter 13 n=1 Tax=Mangifera indica TaxID=29780 RepID=UPI001CFC1AFE|nr:probable potassium transporter 13 [Mangifera indica]